MNCAAILLAAGKGNRYNGSKQDILFHGKPLWRYVCEAAQNVVGEGRIVTVGKDIPGGDTRTESVVKGLESLPADTERVIILEAARPLVTEKQILRLREDSHPSVSFVHPLVNTVVYRNGTYLNREELYELLTPQAFDFKLLLEAYRSGKFHDMTDETRVMSEYHGIKPYFMETGSNLLKVTYPGDLDMIEAIYRSMREGTFQE